MAIRPKPKTDDNHIAYQCRKCGGTGVYATMVLDGRPYSPTGTTCWACNGRGWQIRRKPRRRGLRSIAAGQEHTVVCRHEDGHTYQDHYRREEDGTDTLLRSRLIR